MFCVRRPNLLCVKVKKKSIYSYDVLVYFQLLTSGLFNMLQPTKIAVLVSPVIFLFSTVIFEGISSCSSVRTKSSACTNGKSPSIAPTCSIIGSRSCVLYSSSTNSILFTLYVWTFSKISWMLARSASSIWNDSFIMTGVFSDWLLYLSLWFYVSRTSCILRPICFRMLDENLVLQLYTLIFLFPKFGANSFFSSTGTPSGCLFEIGVGWRPRSSTPPHLGKHKNYDPFTF